MTKENIEEQGWSLNPGRYTGVAEKADDDFVFAERLEELNEELEVLNSEASELEQRIANNVAKLLEGGNLTENYVEKRTYSDCDRSTVSGVQLDQSCGQQFSLSTWIGIESRSTKKLPDASAMELFRMPDAKEPSDLQPSELLQMISAFFESRQIVYRVVGSMASIAYGENRFTNDIDIVADVRLADVDALSDFCQPPHYFLARHFIEDAIRKRFQFNIIHITSGLKIDVMLPKDTEYAALEQRRARAFPVAGSYRRRKEENQEVYHWSPERALFSR